MEAIFDRITLMIPGLCRLSQAELKKEDISELNLLKQPQLDRVRKTGYSFCSTSSDGFRRSLLKWVKEEFSPADYRTFQEEAELLRQTHLLLKAATLRTSRP
jgi:hypothetical protein